jgi:hypothetical protein
MILAGGAIAVAVAPSAFAAGEPVNIWLTTTNDSGGRNVTRGLQQQTPVNFASSSGQVPGRDRCQFCRRYAVADLDVHRRRQPEMDPAELILCRSGRLNADSSQAGADS